MTPPYRLAIFDFDGTLADTMEQFGTFVNRAADRFGFPRLDDAQLESLRDADAKEIVKRLRIPFWQVPRIARYMRSLGASEPIRLFGEAADLLYTLRDAGVRITIVSSNAEANIRRALGEPLVGLVERFECGVSLYGKASRIRRVVRKARVPSEHAIYVGDELRDAEASAAARVDFGAVSWGYNRADVLQARAPRHLFTDFDDLASKVGGAGLRPAPAARRGA